MEKTRDKSNLKVQDKEEKESPNGRFKNQAMVQYETFESSSGGEEMSHGIFESEALSFQNREKRQNSQEKEAKRQERLKRKYKKVDDKVRAAKIDEKMKRKRQKRLQLKLEKTRYSEAGEFEDDVL